MFRPFIQKKGPRLSAARVDYDEANSRERLEPRTHRDTVQDGDGCHGPNVGRAKVEALVEEDHKVNESNPGKDFSKGDTAVGQRALCKHRKESLADLFRRGSQFVSHARFPKREGLNQLLGRDVATLFRAEFVPEQDTSDLTLDSARQGALMNRPEVRQAQLKEKQAEYDRRLAKAEYIPDLSLEVRYQGIQRPSVEV